MKKFLCILLLFALTGCSVKMLKRPAVLEVHKIAIISFYANADIHDINATKDPKSKLSILNAMLGKKEDRSLENNELVQVVTYGLQTFGEHLGSVGNWQVVPPQDVLNSKEYKTLMDKKEDNSIMGSFLKAIEKAAQAQWVTPPGMAYIPVSSVTYGSGTTVIIKGQKDPVQFAKEKMAKLCNELNVDAVAIIGLDLAYKKGMLSGMSGTGLFDNVRGSASPMVASEIAVVTKNAEIAVESQLLSKGGVYSKSQAAPMMLKGRPDLKDSAGKSVEAYNVAVQNNAKALTDKIIEELNGK